MSKLFYYILLFFIFSFSFQLNAQPEVKKLNQNLLTSKSESIPRVIQSEIDSLQSIISITPKGRKKSNSTGKYFFTYASMLGNVDLARPYSDSVKLLVGELKNDSVSACLNYYYGMFARYDGKYSEAFDYLTKQIEYCEVSGDSSQLANSLYLMAVVQMNLGNYDKCLATSYRAIELYEKQGFFYGVSMAFMNVGLLLVNMKKYDDAIEMYHKALTAADSMKRNLTAKISHLRLLINLGNAYAEMKQYEKARMYYKQSLLISDSLGSKRTGATILSSFGEILNKMGRYDSALAFHLKALDIREKASQKDRIINSLIQVGETYMFLKNYDLAEHYLLRALSFSKEFHAKPGIRDAYEKLSALYSIMGNFQKAYEYHKSFSLMKDSVLNEETTRRLDELQTKYETGEKDKQITLLAKEKEVQEKEAQRQATLRRTLIGGLILVSLLTVLLLYIFRQRLKNQRLLTAKNNEVKEVNYKRQLGELEKKALRAQINPHFLYNCINSINLMILNGETDNASLYLTKFSKLMRLILENAESATVSLENELALLQTYIQLEELRLKGKISCTILVDKSVDPDSTYLPSMVLQPFVENAIWHGLIHKNKEKKGLISITVKKENNWLICTIEDNGVGREKSKELQEKSVLKSKSMGMKITGERLRLLTQEDQQQLIKITDLKDTLNNASGTRIEINIPIS